MSKSIKQKIELLQLVRVMLVEREARGICYATHRVTEVRPDLRKAAVSLRAYIRDALDPYTYLEGFVAAKVGREVIGVFEQRERMLTTRLAWIDWIIEQYESQLAARGEVLHATPPMRPCTAWRSAVELVTGGAGHRHAGTDEVK